MRRWLNQRRARQLARRRAVQLFRDLAAAQRNKSGELVRHPDPGALRTTAPPYPKQAEGLVDLAWVTEARELIRQLAIHNPSKPLPREMRTRLINRARDLTGIDRKDR